MQSALRDAWKSKFGKFEFFSSWVSLVRFHVLLRSVVGFIFYWLRHFNRSALSVSVLLYMFPVFFSWGSPSFQIFPALCFCVVSDAGGSALSLLVHSV